MRRINFSKRSIGRDGPCDIWLTSIPAERQCFGVIETQSVEMIQMVLLEFVGL